LVKGICFWEFTSGTHVLERVATAPVVCRGLFVGRNRRTFQIALDKVSVSLYRYSVLIHVNPASGVPTYLQIESQVKHCVASGALASGDAIPSVRKLAADLRVSPNTVARAYQDLESEGVLRTVPGGRTYVADVSPGLLKSEKIRRLRPYARQIAVEGKQLRLDSLDVLKLVRQELDALEEIDEQLRDLDRKSG